MVFYSPMDLISQLMNYEKALGLEFDGKMIDDCIVEVQENCPHIYTNQDLKSMCKENLARIQEEYGFRGLRVWYHSARKNLMLKDLCRDEDGWGGDDMIERKYYRYEGQNQIRPIPHGLHACRKSAHRALCVALGKEERRRIHAAYRGYRPSPLC